MAEKEKGATDDDPIRLISIKEICKRLGYSRHWVYQRVRSGEFPQPIRLGRETKFVESEFNAWMKDQVAQRRAA